MNTSEAIIEHPYMGERIEFVETPQKPSGDFIEFYHYMSWKGSGYLREHVHPLQDELFEVIKGKAQYYVKGKRYRAKAGDIIVIPKGYRHINPHNAWFSELVIKKYDRQELRSDDFYRSLYNMARKHNGSGNLNLRQCLKLSSLTDGNTLFTPIPGFIQKLLIRLASKQPGRRS